MKKVLALVLCLLMALSLFSACGSKEQTTPAASGDGSQSSAGSSSAQPASTTPTAPPNVTVIGAGGDSVTTEIVEAEQYQKTFRIGGQVEFLTLDIHETQNAYYIFLMTHDTLVTFNNVEFSPALATEWKQIDGTHYEFKLREGVTFQDGSPFTAEDVVFTFERGLASPTAALASKLSCVEKVEAKDDYTVLFTLNKANQDFMIALSGGHASILSKTATERDADGFKIGTGPWIVTDFVPSISVTMKRYDGFWGELPKSEEMVYTYIPDNAARLVALRANEIDSCHSLDATDYAGAVADTGIHAIQITDGGTAIIAFDQRDPLLADVNFRKAICYAVDPEDCIAVSREGSALVAKTVWGIDCFGETDEVEGFYYDPDLAKEYLEKSNYQGETISIMCAVKHFIQNANVVAGFLNDIGIETVIDERDFVGLLSGAAYDSPVHQLVSFGTTWANLPDQCRSYLYEGMRNNYTCVPHPEIQQLIDDALVEADSAKRADMYRQVQQLSNDEALYLPIYHSVYYVAEALNVGGIGWVSDTYNYNYRYACRAIAD